MYGKLESWNPQKHCGMVCVETDLGNGQRRLERFFLGERQIVLLAVPEIKTGCWVFFPRAGTPPLPGQRPPVRDAEIWGSPALAWQADKARGSSGKDAGISSQGGR